MTCPMCGLDTLVDLVVRRALVCEECGFTVSEVERQVKWPTLTLASAAEQKVRELDARGNDHGVAYGAAQGRIGQ